MHTVTVSVSGCLVLDVFRAMPELHIAGHQAHGLASYSSIPNPPKENTVSRACCLSVPSKCCCKRCKLSGGNTVRMILHLSCATCKSQRWQSESMSACSVSRN